MPIFEYQARTKEGKTQTGRVEAVDKNAAVNILQNNDLVVVFMREEGKKLSLFSEIELFQHVNKKDISLFSRQLATMFEASVPLVRAINTLANQIENTKLRKTTLSIAADVEGGMQLSEALRKHPKVFSDFYVEIVKVGEESGTLDQVLGYLADYTEREYEISSNIRGAMIYPAFILGVFTIIGIIMLTFIIPQLLGFITRVGGELPLITRVLIAISETFRSSWHIILILFAAFGFGAWKAVQTSTGREIWNKIQLKIPVIKSVYKQIYHFRFAESFGMLVKGGVPINKSLAITADVIGNDVYRDIVKKAQDAVTRGERISDSLSLSEEISPILVQMVNVGERTGKLDFVLNKISDFFERELNDDIDNLISLIEPTLIIIMGVLVGLMMVGVLLPIYGSITSLS